MLILSVCSERIMSVIFTRATPLRLSTSVSLKRIFVHENSMTPDVDDLVLVDLRRIVHAKCPAQLIRIHQRVHNFIEYLSKLVLIH